MGAEGACALLESESQLSFVLKYWSSPLARKAFPHSNPCGIGKGTDSKQGPSWAPRHWGWGRDALGVPGGWVPRNTESSISRSENLAHDRFHWPPVQSDVSETCLSVSACVSAMPCAGPRCSHLGSLLLYSEKKQDKNVWNVTAVSNTAHTSTICFQVFKMMQFNMLELSSAKTKINNSRFCIF